MEHRSTDKDVKGKLVQAEFEEERSFVRAQSANTRKKHLQTTATRKTTL